MDVGDMNYFSKNIKQQTQNKLDKKAATFQVYDHENDTTDVEPPDIPGYTVLKDDPTWESIFYSALERGGMSAALSALATFIITRNAKSTALAGLGGGTVGSLIGALSEGLDRDRYMYYKNAPGFDWKDVPDPGLDFDFDKEMAAIDAEEEAETQMEKKQFVAEDDDGYEYSDDPYGFIQYFVEPPEDIDMYHKDFARRVLEAYLKKHPKGGVEYLFPAEGITGFFTGPTYRKLDRSNYEKILQMIAEEDDNLVTRYRFDKEACVKNASAPNWVDTYEDSVKMYRRLIKNTRNKQ